MNSKKYSSYVFKNIRKAKKIFDDLYEYNGILRETVCDLELKLEIEKSTVASAAREIICLQRKLKQIKE